MWTKHALYANIARRTSVQAALIENDLAYMATKKGRILGGLTTINIKWGELDRKFDYMVEWKPWTDPDGKTGMVPEEEEQSWLVQLEDAGIIQLDSDDDKEEWIVSFETKYLMERGAYNG